MLEPKNLVPFPPNTPLDGDIATVTGVDQNGYPTKVHVVRACTDDHKGTDFELEIKPGDIRNPENLDVTTGTELFRHNGYFHPKKK